MTSQRPDEPTTPDEPAMPAGRPPEGHTPEEPDAQMDAHTDLSDDDHGHAEPRLGPIDWPAWGFAALGVAAGLIVVVLFSVAAS